MSTTHLDDLELIRDQARRYLGETASPEHLKALLETPGSFDRQLWAGAVEQGWPSVSAPESLGGLGLGWAGLSVLADELGQKTVSLPLIAGAVTLQALTDAGDANLLAQFGEALVSGKMIACLAFAESGEAGLPDRPQAQFRDGKLTGSKAITSFAAVADIALLHAMDGDEVALLLVPLSQAGVERRIAPSFDQARAAASLVFDAAEAHRLDAGDGAIRAPIAFSQAALATAFEQIGGADASLRMARDYALERKAFGQVIGRFQAIKHKLADMYWRIEIARGCALDALAALQRDDPLWQGLCAAARVAAIDAYDFAAQENAQTHGGLGITWEGMPQHHSRRARALALELGAKPYWRDRLLDQVGFGV